MDIAKETLSSKAIGLIAWTTTVVLGVHLLRTWARLRSVPGPLWASISDLPRLYWVWTRKPFLKHVELHKKYGKLVRLGPNMVSVADPGEIKNIYGFNYDFNKSDFYSVMLPYMNGRPPPGLITQRDANVHRQLKKPVVPLFATSNLLSYESFIDNTTSFLIHRLDESFSGGKICDFGLWLEMFVFDVLGEMTFSKRYGFLEKGEDIEHIIEGIEDHFDKVSMIGQIPWMDTRLHIRPMLSRIMRQPEDPIMSFQFARMGERAAMAGKPHDKSAVSKPDLLTKFMEIQASDPTLPPWAAVTWIATNIGAGSDTTAIILRAIFYNLLKHPRTLSNLLSELQEAAEAGKLSKISSWKECQDLPYLDACIKEAERIHPAVGLPLERVVPPGGATICGQHFSGGTIVGINAFVVHQNKGVFGDDAASWRPERWLCDKGERNKMEAALLTFGAGSRVCYGKNFSHLIIYKLVASILQAFEISLANPDAEWRDEGAWFVVQKDFHVRLSKKS